MKVLFSLFYKLKKRYFTHIPLEKYKNQIYRSGSRGTDWLIPDILNKDSVCYMVGAGEDISFDIDLVYRYNCKVCILDPTPKSIVYVNNVLRNLDTKVKSKLIFLPIGLWSFDGFIEFYEPLNKSHVSHSIVNLQKTNSSVLLPVKRLSEIMKDNGHQAIDFLKIDIEGAEYEVINTIIEDEVRVKILSVEFDEFNHEIDGQWLTRINNIISTLREYGMKPILRWNRSNITFINSSLLR